MNGNYDNGISLCMIVLNEGKNLKRCLESVKGIVDEIIIVDTGSTDNTKEIAKLYTDKVFDLKWPNDFALVRNFSLQKATKKWILSLDADEVISTIDHNNIKSLLKCYADGILFDWRDYTNEIGVKGFISSRDDIYPESKLASGYDVSKVLRFFKNGYKFEGKIHETVSNSISKSNGKILESSIVIHHYGNMDKKHVQDKKQMYIELLKNRLKNNDFTEKPKDWVCFELAKEYIQVKDYNSAKRYLRLAIELDEYPEYLLVLGSIYLNENNLDEAEKLLKKSVQLDPNNSTVHDNLGILFSKRGEYNKAIRKFNRALELNPNSAEANYNLGKVYEKLGKFGHSEKYFQKAVELNPKFSSLVG